MEIKTVLDNQANKRMNVKTKFIEVQFELSRSLEIDVSLIFKTVG